MDINKINQDYSISGYIKFTEGNGGLHIAEITNKFATAKVSLYGAQVLNYQPHGQPDLLWTSPKSEFAVGKAIRGGIPLCFPWFGPHETDKTKPQHGFGRLCVWEVIGTKVFENDDVILCLKLSNNEFTNSMWQYAFEAIVTIIVGKSLDLTLTCINTGTETFTYTDALHSYFNIFDCSNVNIIGFESLSYLDTLENNAIIVQNTKELKIDKELNRRYLNHADNCIINDAGFNRKINVAKRGSSITVVWNPFVETTKKIADVPDDGYKTFVCIEAANTLSDVITLKPNEKFSLSTIITAY